jgi:hypothetical protein
MDRKDDWGVRSSIAMPSFSILCQINKLKQNLILGLADLENSFSIS